MFGFCQLCIEELVFFFFFDEFGFILLKGKGQVEKKKKKYSSLMKRIYPVPWRLGILLIKVKRINHKVNFKIDLKFVVN